LLGALLAARGFTSVQVGVVLTALIGGTALASLAVGRFGDRFGRRRSYVVFFGWDSAELTPEARSVVQAAAQSARESRVTRIELTGHADRSGSDAYNMSLSQRRADAVKAELVRLGLAANQIGTAARGESQPLVPPADGVREPQNRRVQIVFPTGPTS